MEFTEYRDKVIEAGETAFNNVAESRTDEIRIKTPLMIEYARHGKNYFNIKNILLFSINSRSSKIDIPNYART